MLLCSLRMPCVLAVCLTLLLAAPLAKATPLVDQRPSTTDRGSLGGLISGVGLGLQQSDDFVITATDRNDPTLTPAITDILFWGFYEDTATTLATLPTDDFTVRIFGDNNGLPLPTPEVELQGLAVFREIAGFQVTPGFLGPRDVYEYSVELPAPLQLDSGQRYHLSVLNDVTDRPAPNDNNWFWLRSNQTFDTGRGFRTFDGEPWAGLPNEVPESDDPNAPLVAIAGDLAFVLIPEPSTSTMLLLALASCVRVRRRFA